MSSILKVDEIQNTDGQSALVINPDGSLESVKFSEITDGSAARVITGTEMSSYEDGTWTPVSTAGVFTQAEGRYTRVGRLVYASFNIQVPASANANHFQINGLPFSNGNTSAGQNHGSMSRTDMGTNAFTFWITGTSILLRNLTDTDFLRYNAYVGKFISGAVTYTTV